jgi:DNA end-binding protein Ku
MRAIWNGAISFGLVNIPVGVFSATHSERISFHFLHKKDMGRIHNKRVCELEDKEVDYEDLVRGYEYEKGEYVALEDEDFDRIAIETNRNISIVDFVDQAEIDPMFFDTPYYLAPGKNADHVYALFREALSKSGKVGIGKVAFREREHLAAVKAHGNALMLDTLFFADEIAKTTGLDLPSKAAKITERERKLAEQLIDEMSTKFEPEKYKDTYREALIEMIDQKLKGKGRKTKKVAARKATTNVVDIMSKLKASLKASQPKTRTKAKATKARSKRSARAKAA